MASSVSVRVYLLQVQRRGIRKKLSFDALSDGIPVPAYVSQFISDCSITTEDAERERSWHFEEREKGDLGTSKGYIRYGISGFESRIVDSRTRKAKYNRKTTDSEIVP